MSSSSNRASAGALDTFKGLAEQYYGLAIPALSERFGAINTALGQSGGLPDYMKSAYSDQRTNLTEGIAGAERSNIAGGAARSKSAVAGGNIFAGMSTSDMGAKLADALYGSKFQEGQAGINQTMNLMSMALGGSGTAGNASLSASGNELNAIRFLPNYNPTYANIVGGAAGGASIYGALNQAGVFGSGMPSPVLGGASGLPGVTTGVPGGGL